MSVVKEESPDVTEKQLRSVSRIICTCANARVSNNAGLMVDHCLRRFPNINQIMGLNSFCVLNKGVAVWLCDLLLHKEGKKTNNVILL